jgi:hypothetical protein
MPESPEIAALAKQVRDGLEADEQATRAVVGINALARLRRGMPIPRWIASPGGAGIDDTEGIPRVKFTWVREREHILRHDPHRVLADVAARRTLLDKALGWKHGYATKTTQGAIYCAVIDSPDSGYDCDCGRDERVRAVLTALATPYQEADRG